MRLDVRVTIIQIILQSLEHSKKLDVKEDDMPVKTTITLSSCYKTDGNYIGHHPRLRFFINNIPDQMV